MGGYPEDRTWADQYLPQLGDVVRSLLIKTASFSLDTKQATDLIVYRVQNGPRAGQPVGAIAARVRRPGNFWQRSFNSRTWWGLQFTIRSMRSSGTETEYSKITKGFGDWFVYGHVEQTQLRHWMVLDLEVFRDCDRKHSVIYEPQNNKDGTYFRAYDVTTFPPNILIGTSETIKRALAHGVNAVEPLPSRLPVRRLRKGPDLQELVARHGGYHLITPAAWAEYDRAIEEYRRLMRAGLLEVEDHPQSTANDGAAA